MGRSKWDGRFLSLAKLVAGWSKDPSTQVGAVIVDRRHRIVSMGFNGLPHGVKDDGRLDDRELKLQVVIHAEENALLFAGRDVTQMVMYVYPLPPCSRCASKIIQSGIGRIVSPVVDTGSKWYESVEISKGLFEEAGVELDLVGEGEGGVGGYDQAEADAVMKSVQESWWSKNGHESTI